MRSAALRDSHHYTGKLPPIKSVVEEVLAGRTSSMIDSLHSLFHLVASRKIKTRFGLLSDDPRGNVERRDAHDAVAYRGVNK